MDTSEPLLKKFTEITKVGQKMGVFAKFCAKKNDHELKIGF